MRRFLIKELEFLKTSVTMGIWEGVGGGGLWTAKSSMHGNLSLSLSSASDMWVLSSHVV